MRAALLTQPQRIEVDILPEPEPGPGEVRVEVEGVGLCGSDLAVFSGRWESPSSPWVMGHEAFGVIDAVGRGVSAERIGQSVVVEPNVVCFSCRQCRSGRTSACEARESIGMNRQGALAERLVLPEQFAWHVTNLAQEDLACFEPVTVVLAALRRLGGDLPASALVVGAGAQGLLMTLVLLDRGVEVHVHDVNPDRIAFAESLGARALTEKGNWPLVVETVGSPASTETAFDRLEVGGTLLYLGLDGRPLPLTAQMLVRRQAVLRGSLTYDHPQDFAATRRLLADRALAPGRVITDVYPLEDAQRAFERSLSVRGKTWIRVRNAPAGS